MEVRKAFENASTNVAAAQMRNALTELAETVKDPEQKKVIYTQCRTATMFASNTWRVAVRDRNGQLLLPLPTIP